MNYLEAKYKVNSNNSFPGDQNRAEDRYEEEAYNPNDEGQHAFQSLSPD